MELRRIDKDSIAYLYDNNLSRDFPANEIKPLETILSLVDEGRYIAYGFFEQEELYGYAFFTTTGDGQGILLDYFAVKSAYRSQGYGSRFLRMIKEELKADYLCVMVEVEAIDYAKNQADAALRFRRISFYERNGLRHSGLISRFCGEHFIILLIDLQDSVDDSRLATMLTDVYCAYFNADYVRDSIIIENAPHSTVYAGVDYAKITC